MSARLAPLTLLVKRSLPLGASKLCRARQLSGESSWPLLWLSHAVGPDGRSDMSLYLSGVPAKFAGTNVGPSQAAGFPGRAASNYSKNLMPHPETGLGAGPIKIRPDIQTRRQTGWRQVFHLPDGVEHLLQHERRRRPRHLPLSPNHQANTEQSSGKHSTAIGRQYSQSWAFSSGLRPRRSGKPIVGH